MKKIKSVTTFTYDTKDAESFYKSSFIEYDENGNVIEATDWAGEGIIESKTITRYNPDGKITKEINYVSDDEISDHAKYIRDGNGVLQKIEIHYADGSVSEKIYEYNHEENARTIRTLDESGEFDGKEYFRFDKNGNVVKKAVYNYEGNLEERIISTYDEQNKITRQTEYDKKDRIVVQRDYTYDDKGNLTQIISSNEKNQIIDKIITAYDEQNRIVEQNIKSSYLFKYFYDDGNHIKKEERYNSSGELIYLVETKFDENGLIIEETSPLNTIKYLYEYF